MDFELFDGRSKYTDDTVLTMALADALLVGDKKYREKIIRYAITYPFAGYRKIFREWLYSRNHSAYNSFGNGAAMRVSPVAWAFDTMDKVLEEAALTAKASHSHLEAIDGAQAVAAAIFLARGGHARDAIAAFLAEKFKYNLDRTLDEIRTQYKFTSRSSESVPEAMIAFLESTDYESAVRNAVSLGGDSDTLACMAGAVAEAFYGGVPDHIAQETLKRIPDQFIEVLEKFYDRFGSK